MKRITIIIVSVLVLFGCSSSDDFTITKEMPTEVAVGETFDITVSLQNNNSELHELRSIDIDEAFLEGIMIVKTTPPTQEDYENFGQHIFEFRTELAKSQVTQVILTAKAVKAGDFTGDFDTCIDSDISCTFQSIRIIAKEEVEAECAEPVE